MGLVDKILRAGEGKAVKQLAKIAQEVNAFENQITSLDDDALRGKTAAFKLRYENGESLDSLLPEAFAVVREAAKRTLDNVITMFKLWVVLRYTEAILQK